MKRAEILFVILFLFPTSGVLAQAGKITGTVTDAETGEPLPGVNVVVLEDGELTTRGAQTNAEGFYAILNVTPGAYALRASFIGYTAKTKQGVRVNIDLTTEVNFALPPQTIGMEQVVVQAEEEIVDPDVSANVAKVDISEETQNIPVAGLPETINLLAGVESGLSIRGGGASAVKFIVDGLSVTNPRYNQPFTGIAFTSISRVQVQTGGFNAEYGNVRSGLINVVTKSIPRDRYMADVITYYSPPSKQHRGLKPSDPQSYWMRPYLDPDVAFVGTHSEESPWDQYTRAQYPQFVGWNAVSERFMSDDDPSNDLTPEQLQEQFRWYHRKAFPAPSDFVIDGTVGGPVPLVSDALGDLRFLASYRQTKSAFTVPQRREAARNRLFQLKLTSNLAPGVTLGFLGVHNTWHSQFGGDAYTHDSNNRSWLFALDRGSLQNNTTTVLGAKLTHMLSSNTFYEVRMQRSSVSYKTGPGPRRDFGTIIHTIGPKEYNAAPFGFNNNSITFGPSGMELGGRWGLNRDSTNVVSYNLKFDLTSQINQYIQPQVGFELYYTDYRSAHGIFNPVQPSVSNPKFFWHRKSTQAAAYVQSKFEFENIVANVGLRLDYFHPLGKWYAYNPFGNAFDKGTLEGVDMEPIDPQWALSPRLGVSFPITRNSKIYFNYGHFQSTQALPSIFDVRTVFGGTAIDRVGNPALPMRATIAYELGYAQNLFDTILLRISGYYKALEDQPRWVSFVGLRGVSYAKPLPLNYGDIRGVEISLEKNVGTWVRGEVNYTYMVEKSGNFGYGAIYENRSRMREYIRQQGINFLNTPNPQPYANLRLEFRTPSAFGPQALGGHPLSNWRLGFIGGWRAGELITYTGFQDNLGVSNNLRWRDIWTLDLRITKNIETSLGGIQLFVDINNVLNLKRCCGAGFDGSFDLERYMKSLHLPEDTFQEAEGGDPYVFPYGNDHPGVYREEGVPFVPIEAYEELPEEGWTRTRGMYGPLFYEKTSGKYFIWDGESSAFVAANQEKVDWVLENKAYINMPNDTSYTFLNPRNFWFGIRITL